jgi:hypothetical protein
MEIKGEPVLGENEHHTTDFATSIYSPMGFYLNIFGRKY